MYSDSSVAKIPVDRYTHLLYSFANMSESGTVYLSDEYADTQVRLSPAIHPLLLRTTLFRMFKYTVDDGRFRMKGILPPMVILGVI